MTITKDNAREVAARLVDFADGKLQGNVGGEWWDWVDRSPPSFEFPMNTYRRKPEPKLRAWRWDEVPVGAVYRKKGSGTMSLIFCVHKEWDTLSISKERDPTPAQALVEGEWRFAHEPDTAWRACGVEI